MNNKSIHEISYYDRDFLKVGNRIKVFDNASGEMKLISRIENYYYNPDGTVIIETKNSIYTDGSFDSREPMPWQADLQDVEKKHYVIFRGKQIEVTDMSGGDGYVFLTIWNGFTVSVVRENEILRVVVDDAIVFGDLLNDTAVTLDECLRKAFRRIDSRIAELELAKAYVERMEY